MNAEPPLVGVLLAGGRARRMGGGDKCLKVLAGRTLIEHVIARARAQIPVLILNVNQADERFRRFGLPLAMDAIGGFAGPLAGILAGMEWARAHVPGCRWLVSFPTDTPLLAPDLVARLRAAMEAEGADLACAASGGHRHPVLGLWPVRLAGALRAAMVEEGIRRIDRWTARYRLATAEFSTEPFDPFFNVNTPEDLEAAERLLAQATAPAGSR